jgi:hypothetical protein
MRSVFILVCPGTIRTLVPCLIVITIMAFIYGRQSESFDSFRDI